jgi:hypothetical protein
MTTFTMITQAGLGITMEPEHDLVRLQLSNALGGRLWTQLTIEDAEELAAMLLAQVNEAREAFGE